MIKRFIALALVLLLAIAVAIPAIAADGDGTIQGSIINMSLTGGNVADQTITLRTYQGGAEIAQTTAKTDADGNFTFSGLSTNSTYGYLLTLNYQNAAYQSDPVILSDNTTRPPLVIPVWNSTSDESVVRVDTAHIIITPQDDNLEILQFYLVANDSDLTYIGNPALSDPNKAGTLHFSVPADADGLQFDGMLTSSVLTTAEGITDTAPVTPGQKEIGVKYTVPIKSGKYVFNQNIYLPTDNFNVFVSGQSPKVTSNQLTTKAPVTDQNNYFQYLSGDNFTKGQTITVDLAGLSGGSGGTSPAILLMWTGLGIVVLAGGFVWFTRMRKHKTEAAVVIADDTDDERELLLAELAQLDDDFEAGNIPEEAYQKQRAEKKAQIIRLTPKSGGNE